MKNIGFTIVSLIGVGLLVGSGYIAVISLSQPKDNTSQVSDALGDLYPITSEPSASKPIETEPVISEPTVIEKPTITSNQESQSTHSELLAEIQKLLDAKTVLKVGSRGDAVGSVQKFMNIYFKKTSRVDSDFGKITEADVKKFQSQNKLPQTGQVGTQSLTTMVAWLKNN